MRGLTLGIAALLVAVPLASAQALDRDHDRSRHSNRFGNVIGGAPMACDFDGRGGFHRGDGRHGDRPGRGGTDCIVGGGWGYYGGEWALYNNRSWESDSYNDWWHDRPDRAFPRWVQNNQNCERIWSSGAGWRC